MIVFEAIALEGLLIQTFFEFNLLVGFARDNAVLRILLQSARPQPLLLILESDALLMVLECVRNVRIIRNLVFLHFGQELAIFRLRGLWTQVFPVRLVVRERSVHFLARLRDLRWGEECVRHLGHRVFLF